MSWEYSENILVQNSAGKVLKDKLGWEVVFAYNTEVLGDSGTLGRKSYKEIVLTRYLRQALFDNNDWMTEEYADSAVKILCANVNADRVLCDAAVSGERVNALDLGAFFECFNNGVFAAAAADDENFHKRRSFIGDLRECRDCIFLRNKECRALQAAQHCNRMF